ncbi:MAG: DUF1003 domain-containing protein [Alphaproteobacteria bacterium]|nr:DUF1003 domain-containing protein [Alphaproteobacteria bacterium]
MTAPPPPIAAVLARRRPVRDSYHETCNRLSRLERAAVWITDRVGSMGFFLLIAVWTFLWLSWNLLAPAKLQFDPPMAFVLWLFMSNVMQILLMPLIMVGQNVQGRHSEVRAQHDLEVNVKAEQEIEVILRHLEYQNSLLLALQARLDRDVTDVLDRKST